MKSVAIIGFGSFGQFLAEKLSPHMTVSVFSYSGKPNKWATDMKTVASCDYLILSIPIDAYETTLYDLKPLLGLETTVVDVCSVKVQPMAILHKILPNQPKIATHPLFGPESAGKSLAGHTLVVCPELSDKIAVRDIKKFARFLELNYVSMSAEEHDKEMATVQGLTFFISHALKDLKLHQQKLSTPSFEKLLQLAKLDTYHSEDLFKTIQSGNSYTLEIRQQFLELCAQLDKSIPEEM